MVDGSTEMARLAADFAAAPALMQVRAGGVMGKTLNDISTGAKNRAPVDTGALKSSISSSITRRGGTLRGEVGPTVNYAGYVENGTIHMRAQPYLRPATDAALPGYEAALGQLGAEIVGGR
ncbi:MAG: HK97 gp10 family phage protein [Brachybacterium sp.]|uniref:HK97-gp10 family putative phage morphogenesis protein n=1 Tax=Brachybacterium sp. TaxID=1891286 RepID=UPI002648D81A|nr:HK97-gp10 family putative phage morphogenesis protein [Brachybacterium sp.]MDN5687127.1 HK97 gp10 family phage protein [Brachybacterium sp.]